MAWSVPDLSDYLITASRNGGPIGRLVALYGWARADSIAMIRDERKVMLLGKHKAGKPKIHIYTAAGALLSSLNVNLSSANWST